MIRVVIVDDQKVITQGLKVLLEAEPDMEIVATGCNGKEAIQLATDLQPDVLLIDQNMPVMMGIEAVKIICDRLPKIAVLLLSGSDQDDCITDALQAGAKGYLLKTTSAEDLASSIRSVHRGYSQMGPGLLEKLLAKVNPVYPAMSTPTVSKPPQTVLNTKLIQILNTPSQFDVPTLTGLLHSVNETDSATGLMTQLETELQCNPNHVSASYIAGQLIHKLQYDPPVAMKYLRVSFENAQMQNFPLSVCLHICHAAWGINSEETFRWLNRLLGEWSPDQSSRTFFDPLVQVFNPSTEPYRLLKASWEIRQLKELCDQTNTLKSKLKYLRTSPTVVA
jgi:DNA-binding NarL/FixJ family response regulator